MCGRYSMSTKDLGEVLELLEVLQKPTESSQYLPRYNVAPTQAAWIVRDQHGERDFCTARWGFRTKKGRLLVNMKSETIYRFRHDTFKQTRCVVAADGFYEWTGPKGNKSPLFFQPADSGLLRMGGVWEEGEDGVRHFVVLTAEANELIAPTHSRMPVLLAPDDVDAWLRGSVPEARALMLPAPNDALRVTALQKHVNNVRNDGPECHDPADAP